MTGRHIVQIAQGLMQHRQQYMNPFVGI